VQPGGERGSHRFDHVQQDQGDSECLRQACRDHRLVPRAWREVHRHHDAPNQLRGVLDRDLTGVSRRRHQYRCGRLAQDALRRRPEEQLSHPGEAMGADHDERAGSLAGDPKNLFGRLTDRDVVIDDSEDR